jgi:hypothetical protein
MLFVTGVFAGPGATRLFRLVSLLVLHHQIYTFSNFHSSSRWKDYSQGLYISLSDIL